jgi:RHS repeat-associated protein
VRGLGSLETLLQEERCEVFAYVTDQVGVPRELIDGSGRVAWAGAFTAFGRLVEAEPDGGQGWRVESPFRLLGQVYDEESGLSWTRFRCFDAEMGRWLSADPMGLAGGLETFGFDGSPAQIVDPLGLAGNPHGGTGKNIPELPMNQLPPDERSALRQTLLSIDSGISPLRGAQAANWNTPFSNREGRLLQAPGETFREYHVIPKGRRDEGQLRVVRSESNPRDYYYTRDHYRSFFRVPQEEIP